MELEIMGHPRIFFPGSGWAPGKPLNCSRKNKRKRGVISGDW